MTPKELVTVNEMLQDVQACSDALYDIGQSYLYTDVGISYIQCSAFVRQLHEDLTKKWEDCQAEMFSAETT